MSEASEMPDDYAPRGGRTKYTTCRYCGLSFPLREISRHAKTMHFEESTRYTDCRLCGRSIPLRDIREHARNCDGTPEPTFPKIAKTDAAHDWSLADTYSATFDGSVFQEQMRRALIEADEKLAEPIVIDWLRGRGFSVEKCDGGCNPSDGPEEECSLHGRPVAEVWDALAQRTKDAESLRAKLDDARALLREFIDDDPCQLDHHGGCQTHGFLEPDEGETCHVDRARTFLCECSGYSEDRGGGYFELMLEPEPDCPIHGEGVSRA